MKHAALVAIGWACALFALPAFADLADGVNDIRRNGCGGKSGVREPLRSSKGLDAAAREWSKGGRLNAALDRAEYRGTNSASMRVEGTRDESAILRIVRDNYCDTIVDKTFQEIGVFQKGDAVWIVVAAPFVVPSIRDADAVSAKVLSLVNAARSQSRKCGRTSFPAAPPLKLSAMLNQAALTHSRDMSAKDFFEHEGSDGSTVSARVSRVGYRWKFVAENIAVGAQTAEAVVEGWLKSPGHCTNIMGAQYTEMGLAYVTNQKTDAGIYWTQVFAAPL